MSICYPMVIPVAGGGSFDAATTAWINAVVAAGGTVSDTQKSRVDALIVGLKADSLFSANSRLWIHAGESISQQATIDIMALAVAVTTGHAPALGASGYTGNGSTQYVDLGTRPSNYLRDDGSFGAYNILSSTTSSNDVLIGAFDGGACLADILPLQTATDALTRANRGGGNSISGSSGSNRKGMYISVATFVGTEACRLYENGSLIASTTNASSAITTLPNFFALARDDAGSASSFGVDVVAASWIGPGLDATQASNLSTRINTYMTAWGINVY